MHHLCRVTGRKPSPVRARYPISLSSIEAIRERAAEVFRAALASVPNVVVTLANLASSPAEVGEHEKAVDAIGRALAVVPEESWVPVHEETDAIEEERDMGFEPQFC